MDTKRVARICCAGSLLLGVSFALPAKSASAQSSWGDQSYTSVSTSWDDRWSGGNWIGNTSSQRDWKLGVMGENTDTGVIVRQVTPDSAAARANIRTGDVIVCVAGDQVGRVGSQVFDLREELNHHADSNGRVLMLVHSRQYNQLRSQEVRLQDTPTGLSGTLYVDGGRLPSDAVVTVRLENVSRPYYTVRNGEYSFRPGGFSVGDIPFTLNYDPQYISNNDRYQLRAYVTSQGRTIYDTYQPPFVLTQGNPSTARLTLRPASYSPAIGQPVVNVAYNPIDTYRQDIHDAYQQYLGRLPSSMEMAAWHNNSSDLGDRVRQLSLELMATQEYFNSVGGSNSMWLQRVFNDVIGHSPSNAEMDMWMRRFAELRYSRTELLRQLDMQRPR